MIRREVGSADQLLRTIAVKMMDGVIIQFQGAEPTFRHPLGMSEEFVIRDIDDITSPDRGQVMLEIGASMTILNPRNRLIYSKSVDIFNLVGLWFYMLRGSNRLADIEFYNPVARKFTDEEISGNTLRANWGERIFTTGALQGIITLLINHPDTRRAYLPVFHQEDIGVPSRNLPCLAGIQFAKKGGQLDMYSIMRAQSAIGVLPYDLFLLTMLHEYVSLRVGLPLGGYHHIAPLLGIREFEIKAVMELAGNNDDSYPTPMPDMEELVGGRKSYLLDAERRIRQGGSDPDFNLLPPYWQGLLWVTRARKLFRDHDPQWDHALSKATTAFPADFLSRCYGRIAKQFADLQKDALPLP